ncbi:hypothetical protein GCM10022397_38560 [Flavivirga jejuensis]
MVLSFSGLTEEDSILGAAGLGMVIVGGELIPILQGLINRQENNRNIFSSEYIIFVTFYMLLFYSYLWLQNFKNSQLNSFLTKKIN